MPLKNIKSTTKISYTLTVSISTLISFLSALGLSALFSDRYNFVDQESYANFFNFSSNFIDYLVSIAVAITSVVYLISIIFLLIVDGWLNPTKDKR